VDCVEQRRRVEEAPYLIDLKDMNVAGTNKVCHTMSILVLRAEPWIPASPFDVAQAHIKQFERVHSY
jgi:hypothetical protein